MTTEEQFLDATKDYVASNTDTLLQDISLLFLAKWSVSVDYFDDFLPKLFNAVYESSNCTPNISEIDKKTLDIYAEQFYCFVLYEFLFRENPLFKNATIDVKLFDFPNYDKKVTEYVLSMKSEMDKLKPQN